jgi:hypothetical protein
MKIATDWIDAIRNKSSIKDPNSQTHCTDLIILLGKRGRKIRDFILEGINFRSALLEFLNVLLELLTRVHCQ